MDKYEQKNNDSSGRAHENTINSSMNMKDEYFDKMINQNNNPSGLAGVQNGHQNNIEFGYGSLYKKPQVPAAGVNMNT